MIRRHRGMLLTLFGLSLCVTVERAAAQAFCSLRDPVRNIYKVYPEADGYRSIVKAVDQETRTLVAKRLPFTLHFNELGRHTLYVAMKEGQPLGLVHVRSEKGKWGLVEIAWSFDLNLRVRGFLFQRCRDQSQLAIVAEPFASQLIGKGFDELRVMLSEDGESLNPSKISVAEEHAALALTTLRSALKTLAVTDIVWAADLQPLRAICQARAAFPQTQKLQRIDDVYTPDVYRALNAINQGSESIVQRKSVELYRAFDREDRFQGILMKSHCVLSKEQLDLWWSVTPDRRIHGVKSIQGWPGEDFREAFDELEGMTEQDIQDCASATEMVGAEVIVVSRLHAVE